MNRIAIIPARGGSTRIPRKNVKEFHGKPILAYSVQTAMASGLFNAGVWVSTEDPAIARVAWDLGAKVHPRSKELAQNDVGTQQVAREVLRELFPGRRKEDRPQLACVIYATAPMLNVRFLEVGLQPLLETNAPYVYSVGPDGKDAGQFYWGLVNAFLNDVPLEHPLTTRVVLPAERVCDINTMDDWIRAERMYAKLNFPEGPI